MMYYSHNDPDYLGALRKRIRYLWLAAVTVEEEFPETLFYRMV